MAESDHIQQEAISEASELPEIRKRRRIDHTGKRYGRWTALRFSRIRNKKKTIWWCRCDCGAEREIDINIAKCGESRSCGCLGLDMATARSEDLSGARFGRLVVIDEAPKRARMRRWLCRCDCGNVVNVPMNNLKCGKTQSCSCLQKEIAAANVVVMGAGNVKHGQTKTPEWLAWKNMKARCLDEGQESYPDYGGRGITVCERWMCYEDFREDMGARPSAGHSIGRIDTNGNYEPSNCEWQTCLKQQRNRRSNRLLEFRGETKPMSEWAEIYGIKTDRLHRRLAYGWPIDLALETPIGHEPSGLRERRGHVDPAVRLKADARAAVYKAVSSGALIKPCHCQHPGCLTEKIEGHHHLGYEKEHRLDVIWLCKAHHEEAEKETKLVSRN